MVGDEHWAVVGSKAGGPKGPPNCLRVLEDVNRKEKVVNSRLHESEILGRHSLLSIVNKV